MIIAPSTTQYPHFPHPNAGPEFESRILANEASNVKFNFLKPGDPYNAYYQHKIEEIKGGNADAAPGTATPPSSTTAAAQPPLAPPPAPPPSSLQPNMLPPSKPLGPPEPDHYTVHIPEGITLLDLDTIKLTAQFVARNGKSFLTGLASREHSNPQFNFLKPTHSLFTFFTRLCDAYSRVLMPPKGLLAALHVDAADSAAPLQRALHRLEYDRVKNKEAKESEDAEEAERMAMLSIDWHDFVVVETIDFDFDRGEESALPPPVTRRDVLQMARASAFEIGGGLEEQQQREQEKMDEEEAAMVAEGQRAAAATAAATATGEDSGDVDMEVSDEEEEAPIKIVKNYKRIDPRAGAGASGGYGYDPTKFVISPLTGELVAIQDMAEHMRISLIDPKWKKERDVMLSRIKETTRASDEEISRNLSLLARTRPDVFGGNGAESAAAMSTALKASIEEERIQQQEVKKQRRT